MNIDNLIKMANQIGQFFETQPDQKQAQADLSNHILKFWEPRMRKELIQYIDQNNATELSHFVAQSIANHRHLF